MRKTDETKITNSKAAFLDAFCRLGIKHDVDKITVSQLCREAGLNRTTFYKYYQVPADVISEATYNLLETVPCYDEEKHLDSVRTIHNLCRQCYDNRELLRLFISANENLSKMVYRIIKKETDARPFLMEKQNIFLWGGIMQLLFVWMLGGFKESPEEMAELMLKYIRVFSDNF